MNVLLLRQLSVEMSTSKSNVDTFFFFTVFCILPLDMHFLRVRWCTGASTRGNVVAD